MKNSVLFTTILLVSVLSGCATVPAIPLSEQSPGPSYIPDDAVLIAVNDKRKRVTEGKPEEFVGVAHGVYGIPADWHVKQVLATEESDKDKTLAEFLEHRISTGLAEKGWQVRSVDADFGVDSGAANNLLQDESAKQLIVLDINEWFFSINLNRVSAFNFDTDTLVKIYGIDNNGVFEKQIAGRDVVQESSDDSPQNSVLRAYRDQLVEIFDDPEIMKVVMSM